MTAVRYDNACLGMCVLGKALLLAVAGAFIVEVQMCSQMVQQFN